MRINLLFKPTIDLVSTLKAYIRFIFLIIMHLYKDASMMFHYFTSHIKGTDILVSN